MARKRSAEARPAGIGSGQRVRRIALIAALAAGSFGCPLAFDYNGRGAGSSHTTDPSSPKMTVPVTVFYSEEGGTSGTIADGYTFTSGKTTTVTLSTATDNAVIYYTDDGTTIASLTSAKKINGSSGTITIPRTTSVQSLDIHALAIGPNMLPSQAVHATVEVSPYPILSVTCDKVSMTEDGGTATFTIASSSQSDSDITVHLVAGGTYVPANLTGPLPAPGPFTATLTHSTTTITFPITAVHDAASVDHTVTLTIQVDPNSPPAYTVGAPASASVVLKDDGTYTVTYNGNGSDSGTAPTDANSYLPGTPVTVLGNSGSLVKTGFSFAGWNTQTDGNGATYTPGQTLTMGSSNVILYAKWAPRAIILAAFPSVGASPRPEGIIYDGTYIWVGEVNDSKVYKIDPSNGSVNSSFSIPGATHALALDGAGEIWTTSYWLNPPVLYRYPQTFGSYDRSLTLASTMAYPTAMTFDSANNCLWIVNTNSANPYRFWKLDPANGSVLDSWDLAGGTPSVTYGLCMDSDPNYLWMVAGNVLYKVSISGKQVVDTYVILTADLLQGVATVSSDTFWLVDGNNKRILKVQLFP